MKEILRVLIIHGNRLFREGLAFVLTQQQNITVVATVAQAFEILEELEKLRPDVILLELDERDGLGDARLIRNAFSDAKIIMTGLTDLESTILACIEAGAAWYLPQEASLDDLRKNINAVAKGSPPCSPKIASILVSRIAEAATERELRQLLGIPNLTRRELEIIALIEEGLSNKEIAVRLYIEVQTVKNHIHNILDKLQLNGRREAARYARERGMLVSVR